MRITIWDMDFYYKQKSSPNPDLMKISSFHKQQGHLVNFVEEEFHIGLAYDLFYISRNSRNTPPAPSKITDSPKSKLLGKTFRFFPNKYEIDRVIAAVRPDYLLYPEKKKDSYYNADIIQFFHKGVFIKERQSPEKSQKAYKKTLVSDKDFWEAKDQDIEKALIELQNYKNIAFIAPIRVKILIKNKKVRKLFLDLNFNQATDFRFRNDYGSTTTEAKKIVDFYVELKERNPYVDMGWIPIRTVTKDHWSDPQAAVDDIYRILEIADYAKKNKAKLLFIAPPRRRFETPYWYYFEPMEVWSRYYWEKSYIEMMLYSAIKRMNLPWYVILNNSRKWGLPNTNFLLHLMANHSNIIEKYGYTEWGENELDRNLVLDEYKKYKKTVLLEEEEWS